MGYPVAMAYTPPTDAELLAKYKLINPHDDAMLFARMVDTLARQRRATLHGRIDYKSGEYVTLAYYITGYDSAGTALTTAGDSAQNVLAGCIRILNKRYAASQQQAQHS